MQRLSNCRNLSFLFLIIFMLLSIAACSYQGEPRHAQSLRENGGIAPAPGYPGNSPPQDSTPADATGVLQVSFLDVGQADSILIKLPGGKTMLIDAGNNDDGKTVVNFLKSYGVKNLDVLVGTHPHEDHIGGMDDVIEAFDIEKIYMPKVTTTTRTFKDVLRAAEKKNLKITAARGGMSIPLEEGLKADILAPNSSRYDELNNYSIVIKITYKDTSFLFTGDAEKLSEQEMLKKRYDLRADVLKVAHHGSSSGTSEEFLSAVSPEYAVISVGRNNDYGHPHRETMRRLAAHGVKVYTTADNGNLLFSSDGQRIKISTIR
ncbi:ComEC/Rec2 family competence protein [Thermoanaerobacterium sp. DL9XJH110]|uniref:ComEC/Rec2 family competence protein n=1 Tax=Thermoanaerobacterium sp. DL9XJH110 TaxID=3386643 RepID=UPI003BB6FF6E